MLFLPRAAVGQFFLNIQTSIYITVGLETPLLLTSKANYAATYTQDLVQYISCPEHTANQGRSASKILSPVRHLMSLKGVTSYFRLFLRFYWESVTFALEVILLPHQL